MSDPRKRKREKEGVWIAKMTDFKDDYKLRGDDPSYTVEWAFWDRDDAERCVAEAKLKIMRDAIVTGNPYCFALVGRGPESGGKWPSNDGWGGPDCPIRKKYYDDARAAAKQANELSDEALLETWNDFNEGEFVPRLYEYRVEHLKVE